MSTCEEPCDHLFEAAMLSAQLVEAELALTACVEAMRLQEQREREEAHLSQPAMRAIWDTALAKADKVLGP